MNRRELVGSLVAAFITADGRACEQAPATRLGLAVVPPTADRLSPGRHEAGPHEDDGGWVHVPAGLDPRVPAPLLILLHGAGQRSRLFEPARAIADDARVVLLVPDSSGATWDGIGGRFGRDVVRLRDRLAWTIARVPVDPRRLGIGGFSDGASYALGLGLANGDLFTHVIAFSPGFVPTQDRSGRPRLFVTHGTRDAILPIDRTSRRIVPALELAGYSVEYHEFDGPHMVPPALSREAMTWLAGGVAAP